MHFHRVRLQYAPAASLQGSRNLGQKKKSMFPILPASPLTAKEPFPSVSLHLPPSDGDGHDFDINTQLPLKMH